MGHNDTNISRRAVCPYFLGDEKCKIFCEGVAENTTVHLNFDSRRNLKVYADKYCCSMEDYKDCRLCDMLDLKHYKDG